MLSLLFKRLYITILKYTYIKKIAFRYGQEIMVKNLTMIDCQEGIRSFIEKRKPVWTHSFEKCH
jgi:hypothetical protein